MRDRKNNLNVRMGIYADEHTRRDLGTHYLLFDRSIVCVLVKGCVLLPHIIFFSVVCFFNMPFERFPQCVPSFCNKKNI